MERTQGKAIGHIACFIAYAIFGINIIVCKDLTSSNIFTPITLFFIRSLGAALLFWSISLFTPKEHVEKKDLFKILMASVLGFFITQITFLMLHRKFALPHLHHVHSRLHTEGTHHMAQSRRSLSQFPRHHLPDNKQHTTSRYRHTDQPHRHPAHDSQRTKLRPLPRNIQTPHTEIFSHHLHKVDIPLRHPPHPALGSNRIGNIQHPPTHTHIPLRTHLPHRMRHIHHLLPNSRRPEAHPPHTRKHVLLPATHHSSSHKHLHRHGSADLAKDTRSPNGFRRSHYGQL